MGMFDVNKFIVEEKLSSLRPTLCIKDVNGNLLGYIKYQGFPPRNFLFEDAHGATLGEVDRGGAPGGYEVKDQSGQLVARIVYSDESKWRWTSMTPRARWMEDAQGQRLFTTGKGDFEEHGFPIVAPDGNPIAQIHKKWVTARDSYSVEILRQDVNPFLILSYVVIMHGEARRRGRRSYFQLTPY